ncbi:MAG: PEGA domain-containing protein, partial [Candidatus Margulisiibacteriota bacterium]
VQITSDPTYAHIIIDKKVKAVTPWESYLAPGNHGISLELAGYEPLEKKLVVTPGNNRLNFTLMPLGMNDTIIVKENPLPKEKISSKTLFIVSFAGALLAGVAQWQYSAYDKEYDQLISNDKNKYDALDKRAEYSMFLRNTGIVISVSGLCFCTYNRIKNGRWF